MKVEFTQDYSTARKGNVREYRESLAKHFINLGVAKKHEPKRETKEEKQAKKTK